MAYKGYVYRVFLNDEIIYIGITNKVKKRMYTHSLRSAWWTVKTRIEFAGVETYSHAVIYEILLINKHQPRYNIASKYENADFSMFPLNENALKFKEFKNDEISDFSKIKPFLPSSRVVLKSDKIKKTEIESEFDVLDCVYDILIRDFDFDYCEKEKHFFVKGYQQNLDLIKNMFPLKVWRHKVKGALLPIKKIEFVSNDSDERIFYIPFELAKQRLEKTRHKYWLRLFEKAGLDLYV
jgi:hypothetical protein